MKTLIKNGRIITADADYIADILIEDEKIVAIGNPNNGLNTEGVTQTIDATGKRTREGKKIDG